MPKKKSFDCMAMKRRLQRIFYQETKDLTPSELLAHIRRKVEQGPFADLWNDAAPKQARS
jgi:protein-disulfide isomerase-like protein with CxxC motif